MVKAKYGTYEPRQPDCPPIALSIVPHRGKPLIVSPSFGPSTYSKNIEAMQKSYSHSSDLGNFPKFTFRPATTQESISIAAYDFENEAKPKIFDPRWLQTGRIVRTAEGVFTNTQETDESKLKRILNGAKKVNGIYLLNDNVAFAPYESFETGVQESGKFIEGGLARALEHTPEAKADNLAQISKKSNYPNGVNVWGFDSVQEPILRVVSLYSYRLMYRYRLYVGGYYCDDGYGLGFAFGVREVAEGDAQKS